MKAVYVQKGESIDYTPDSAVAAGEVVIQGSLVGVTKLDIPANTLGSLAVVGVYDAEKATGAISAGAVVYWDATNKNATVTATSNTRMGIAVEAATSAAVRVRVLLNA